MPWLKKLTDEFQRFEGRQLCEWLEYVASGFNFEMPYLKSKFALKMLETFLSETQNFPSEIGELKRRLFLNASAERILSASSASFNQIEFRSRIIESVLQSYPEIGMDQLETSLSFSSTKNTTFGTVAKNFGQLSELPYRLNGVLIRKIMMRSNIIEIVIPDHSRRIIRQAKLRGLICEFSRLSKNQIRLRISGPLALFGPTRIYGHRFQEFIPLLFWNLNFSARIFFRVDSENFFLFLNSSSPLKVAEPPVFFDSKIEDKFYTEFGKATLKWNLVREPEPLQLSDRLLFLDFGIEQHPNHESETISNPRIFLEIIGFWTADYIRKKQEDIRILSDTKVIFLVNDKLKAKLALGPNIISTNHRLIFFKRKFPMNEILAAVEALSQIF